MVKVITIKDEVYARLYKLKKSKGMSFSQVIDFLLREQSEGPEILAYAGTIQTSEINQKPLEVLKGKDGKDMYRLYDRD